MLSAGIDARFGAGFCAQRSVRSHPGRNDQRGGLQRAEPRNLELARGGDRGAGTRPPLAGRYCAGRAKWWAASNLNGRRVPCYAPVGDYQCALAGALFGAEELSLNIATGSQISRMTPALALGDYQTRPFFDGKFLNTFTGLPGGPLAERAGRSSDARCRRPRAWNWRTPGSGSRRPAADAPDTDLEVDLSFFGPTRPGQGQIANIRGSNLTVGQLFRAAFKHMAETNFQHALRIWPERAWRNLLFSGGLACKLEVLRQAIQRRFPHRLSNHPV